MLYTKNVKVQTKGFTDTVNITDYVNDAVIKSDIDDGIVNVFVIGSTASITTIEYEPGLKKDMKDILEQFAPLKHDYHHHNTWHDDNGSSHIRATVLGPSITIPFTDKRILTGTWQQIVLIDFDTRPRDREIVIQVLGE